MIIKPEIAALKEEVTGWRRDLHMHPELLYDVHRTAGRVATFCNRLVWTRWFPAVSAEPVLSASSVAEATYRARSWRCGRIWMLCQSRSRPTFPTHRVRQERCMPAAMMAIRQCFLVLPSIFQPVAILTARSSRSSSRQKRAERAHGPCWTKAFSTASVCSRSLVCTLCLASPWASLQRARDRCDGGDGQFRHHYRGQGCPRRDAA